MWRDASLSRRLLTAVGGFITAALIVATILIGFVLILTLAALLTWRLFGLVSAQSSDAGARLHLRFVLERRRQAIAVETERTFLGEEPSSGY